MKDRLTYSLGIFILLSSFFSGSTYAAERFAESYYPVSSSSLSFPLNHSTRYSVNSSWTEPRSTELHPGIDSPGTTVNDVYPLADSAYVYEKGNSSKRGNYLVLRYTINGSYVYSQYMHLNSFIGTYAQGDTIASKTTAVAKVGNTGTSAGVHLHWEILKTYSGTDRISVNPNYFTNWGSSTFSLDAPVFKNFSYNSLTKKVTIRAYDSDLGVKKNVYPKILFKSSSSSTWSYATMDVVNASTYDYSYSLPHVGDEIDIIIAGRRSSSEYWTYYPAKYSAMNNSSNPIPSVTDSKETVSY